MANKDPLENGFDDIFNLQVTDYFPQLNTNLPELLKILKI